MVEFQEYTGWKIEKAKAARKAQFIEALKFTGLVVAGGVGLYAMLWLGAFLDYCAGV